MINNFEYFKKQNKTLEIRSIICTFRFGDNMLHKSKIENINNVKYSIDLLGVHIRLTGNKNRAPWNVAAALHNCASAMISHMSTEPRIVTIAKLFDCGNVINLNFTGDTILFVLRHSFTTSY